MDIEFSLIPIDWADHELKREWSSGDAFKLEHGKVRFSRLHRDGKFKVKQNAFLELRILDEKLLLGTIHFLT